MSGWQSLFWVSLIPLIVSNSFSAKYIAVIHLIIHTPICLWAHVPTCHMCEIQAKSSNGAMLDPLAQE